jgi:methionyl-tRNA formyltransferase
MGTPPFAAHCLARLLETRHPVAAVVTRQDKPRGRGMEVQPSAVRSLADARGLEVLAPASAKDAGFADALRALAPDLCVVVAYGRLLPMSVLEIPPLGCINAHASLLPALRGAAPIERAILEGHERTGVTIMRIEERMDAGAVLSAAEQPIEPSMNAGELRQRLATVAADLLVDAVERLAASRAVFTPQDESLATYAPPLRREEAEIDWDDGAAVVDRRVRGFAPAPGAFTFDGKRRLKVLRGHVRPGPAQTSAGSVLGIGPDGLSIACSDGVYVAETVQPEGKRAMAAHEWARGAGDLQARRLGGAAAG